MPQKIVEAAREHAPELLEGGTPKVPSGKKLQNVADALELAPMRDPTSETKIGLTKRQRRTQQLIGSLKFIEQLHPRISLILHRLSCVMSRPPPDAYEVAVAALAAVYDERDTGITFGGEPRNDAPRLSGHMRASIDLDAPPPHGLEGHADATWGDRNVYGLVLTFAAAAVLCQTKKIALIVDSSMETEAIASAKAGEAVSFAREILRGLGIPAEQPTLIGTDNLSNQSVISGLGAPSRSMHFLRRYGVLKQRVAQGECDVRHVPDAEMPADFLTKWIPGPKVEASLRYVTNSKRRVASSPTPAA